MEVRRGADVEAKKIQSDQRGSGTFAASGPEARVWRHLCLRRRVLDRCSPRRLRAPR